MIAAGVIATSALGILDYKYAVVVLVVEFPLGIISDLLTASQSSEAPPQVKAILSPNTPEAKKLSEEEERLRGEYPKIFVLIDSIKTVKSQREFDILNGEGRVLISMEMIARGAYNSRDYHSIGDSDLLSTILYAHLVNVSDFKRSWWQ